jgi:hypothetical protein
VQGSAFAIADVLGLVLRRSVLSAQGGATSTPKVTRFARAPLVAGAQASTEALLRGFVREPMATQARAIGEIWTGYIRIRVALAAQALATVASTILRRSELTATAEAMATPVVRRFAREPLVGQAESAGVVTGSVAIRHYISEVMGSTISALGVASLRGAIRSLIGGVGSAVSTALLRGALRSPANQLASAQAEPTGRIIPRGLVQAPVTAEMYAQGVASLRANVRNAAISQAQAVGFVGGSVIVRRPFDEVARPENTFVVTFEDNVFYVR